MSTFEKQLILAALFLQSAAGLRCMLCNDPTCSSQRSVNCSSWETFCYTEVHEESYTSGSVSQNHTWFNKGCASAQTCSSTDGHHVSYHTGSTSHRKNATCCDTDNCNEANSSFSVSPAADSLRCYGCGRNFECTNVTCNALESCFTTSTDLNEGQMAMYGCASENLCNNSILSTQYFGHSSVSCCNTSHCHVPEVQRQCEACNDFTCSSQRSVTCSTSMCLSYTYTYPDLNNHLEMFKGCSPRSDLCAAAGNHFVSYHLHDHAFILNITCCDSDNCNTANHTISVPEGSLQCYSCSHYNECRPHVTCNVFEICSWTSFGDSRRYGCVSENLCHNSSLAHHFFGPNVEMSCCNTTNCNVPPYIVAPPSPTPNHHWTDDDDDEDHSMFSAAERVLPVGLFLSALGLCAHLLYF